MSIPNDLEVASAFAQQDIAAPTTEAVVKEEAVIKIEQIDETKTEVKKKKVVLPKKKK